MKKQHVLNSLAVLFLFILAGCGPTLPELNISGNVKGTISIDGSRIQGEPYFIDYSEQGLVLGTTEKSGAAYAIRTYSVKNKKSISLIKETSDEQKYANLFWDENDIETMGTGEACIGTLMAGTPCGGTTDKYGLTLAKQLSDGALFQFACFTQETQSQTDIGAYIQLRTTTSRNEDILYKKGETIVNANNFDIDPKGSDNFSWFLEHRSQNPWLAKAYYLENFSKLVFISAPSSDKRGVYLIDFDTLQQKDRMIKLNDFPFIDIAIHAEKKLAFTLTGNKDRYEINFITNSALFNE